MDRFQNKIVLIIGLGCYVLIIALATIHFRFPYRSAALLAVQEIEAQSPVRLSFRGPEPGWPLNLHLKRINLDIALPGGDQPLFFVDRARLRLTLLSLLTGKAGVKYWAYTEKGRILGEMDYKLMGGNDFRLVVREINLPDFTFTEPRAGTSVKGLLSGEVVILGKNGIVPTGGEGTIRLGPGRVTNLKMPDVPLTEVDFESITVKFKLEKDRVIIESLVAESQQGGVTLNGSIYNLQRPQLNLSGNARMGPADQPLMGATFRVHGPMNQPRLKVTSTKNLMNLQ